MKTSRTSILACVGVAASLVSSCQSTSEVAGASQLTANVGRYDMPPPGLIPPRLGVPRVTVAGPAASGMETLAADQLTTLMTNTDRFDVIERAQLDKLRDEQGLVDMVRDDERAQTGQVRGVDYLMTAAITNFRTKATRTGSNFGVGNVIRRTVGVGVDIDSSNVEIKTECGVDLRIVDATTGSVLVAEQSEFTRSETASSMGLQVLGIGASSDAEIQIDQNDRGLILRLALDDAVKRMLPKLDRKLVARSGEIKRAAMAAGVAPDPVVETATSETVEPTTDASATMFCSACGAGVKGDAKFCASCGAKVSK